MKSSFANYSKSALGLIITIMLGGFCASVHAQTAPSTYSAYTGTDVKTPPPAPTLGPANSVINDPTFGTPILRVTDPNTNGGESFIPTDAGSHRTWNANSTAIKLTGPHGDGYWLEFNPNNFTVGSASANPQIHSVPYGSTWEWSAVNPDIIYVLNGSQIAAYNTSTGATTNLAGTPTGEPVDYFAVVVGQDNWVCAAAGSGAQDSYTKIFCVNPISPSTTKFIDVYNKTINGVAQSDPNWPTSASGQVIGIHGMSGGTGANWLPVTFHQQSWGGNGDAVFDLSTNTWSLVTNADVYWSGHISMGNGTYANSAGSQNGLDSRGILLRNPDGLMNSSQYQFVGQPSAPWNNWCDADHNSWLNSLSNPGAPIISSRYGGNTGCAFAWTGEIVGMAVDGSNTVYRFAHNHNTANVCYYGQSFAQISNDGKWILFSSPWDGNLGSDTAFGCGTRIDTFILSLVPGSGGTTVGTGATSSTGTSSSSGTGSSGTGSTSSSSSTGTSSSTASGSSTSGTSGSTTSSSGTTSTPPTTGGSVTRVEQNGPGVTYTGTWSTNNGSFNSGGSAVMSTTAGSTATIAFNGTGVTWIGYQDQWSGIAQVSVDGVLKATVDTYASPNIAQSPVYSISGLSSGAHTMTITVTGQKDASSAEAWVWVDAFDVMTGSATTGSTGTGTSTSSSGSGTSTTSTPPTSTGSGTSTGTTTSGSTPVTIAGGMTLTSNGSTPLTVGSALVAGTGGATPAGLALISDTQNGVTFSEAGVPASSPALRGRIDSEISSSVNTGFALANPNDSAATVSFFFTDVNGTNFGSGSLTLPPHGQLAKFLNDAPFNGTSTGSTFTFSSNVPVSAIALRGLTNQRSEFLMTTLPVANPDAPSSATAYFPHVPDGGGWTTQFVLVNPTDSAITGTLQFATQGGQTGNSVPYQIAARSAWRYSTSDTAPSVTTGSAEAIPDASNVAPVGVAIFSLQQNGITISTAGVPSLESGTAFRLYAEESADGTVRSGMGIVNVANTPTTIQFNLVNLDGTSTGLTGTINLPAFGQQALFLDQVPGLGSLPKPFQGIVRLSSQNGGAFAVIGLRGRLNERSEFIMTTTAPTNENAATAPQIVFPQIANGGGFLTQFVLYSGTASEPATGTLDVYDQSGGTMNPF